MRVGGGGVRVTFDLVRKPHAQFHEFVPIFGFGFRFGFGGPLASGYVAV